MVGHLFDTKFFNNSLDILESNGLKFRVVEMKIGNTTGEPSQVTLQIIGKESDEFNQAIGRVQALGKEVGVAIDEAMSGPSLEKHFIVHEADEG
jgi:hypothetical protein